MPKLECSELNSNPDSKIILEIKLLDKTEKWQNYEIIFHKGKESYRFSSKNKQVTTYTGDMQAEIGKFAFALEPINELEEIKKQLENFLAAKIPSFIFQPADPSFEFEINKITEDEFKVYFWVDAGNTNQLEYTWDALGIRFLTTREKIEAFGSTLS